MIYRNLVVTTNQKPTKDIQRTKRKKHKGNTEENQETTGEEIQRRTENCKNNQKTANKIAISTYLSISYFKH